MKIAKAGIQLAKKNPRLNGWQAARVVDTKEQ
jgi:hypothetical protein